MIGSLKILEFYGIYSQLVTAINCWIYVKRPYVHWIRGQNDVANIIKDIEKYSGYWRTYVYSKIMENKTV